MISITLVIALALAGAPPSSAPSGQARKAYSACLQKVIKAKTEEKLSADAFKAAAKAGCAVEEAAMMKALTDFDVATGSKRADAEEFARSQIDEYLFNAGDTYASYATPN